MASINEIVEGIRAKAASNMEKMKGINATYQFNLTGEGGGAFYAAIADAGVDVAQGAAPDPNLTVNISTSDFEALVSGKLNPVAAFMSGKIKIQGDMSLAMKLQQLLG